MASFTLSAYQPPTHLIANINFTSCLHAHTRQNYVLFASPLAMSAAAAGESESETASRAETLNTITGALRRIYYRIWFDVLCVFLLFSFLARKTLGC